MTRSHDVMATARLTIFLAFGAILSTPGVGNAADKITFVTDYGLYGRHAYYFVAIEKGYYARENIEIDIVRSPGSANTIKQVANGTAQFGFADALQLRSDDSIRALILFVAIVVGFLALRAIYVGKPLTGAGMIVAAVVFGVYFAITATVPSQFVGITPYVTTLLVLAFAAQRLRPPAADGQPWRKGQQI